jgi:hypothetical protein
MRAKPSTDRLSFELSPGPGANSESLEGLHCAPQTASRCEVAVLLEPHRSLILLQFQIYFSSLFCHGLILPDFDNSASGLF